MKIILSACILCWTILCCQVEPVFAQRSDLGNWISYTGNQKISDKWNWWNEVQYRNFNFAGDLEQLLLRTGIGYNLTENNNNVLLGYAFVHSNPYITGTDSKTTSQEHRIYQQFITRHNMGRVAIQHRYRLEERFLENIYRTRFRYSSSVNVPLNKRMIEKNTFYLSAYNEIFLNARSPAFDRDRVYGGVGYGLSKYLRIETGIMYQLLESKNRPQWQIGFSNSAPFKKAD